MRTVRESQEGQLRALFRLGAASTFSETLSKYILRNNVGSHRMHTNILLSIPMLYCPI